MTPDVYEGVRRSMEPCQCVGVPLQHHRKSNVYWSDFAVSLKKKLWRGGSIANCSFLQESLSATYFCSQDSAMSCRSSIVIAQILKCVILFLPLFYLEVWIRTDAKGQPFSNCPIWWVRINPFFCFAIVPPFFPLRD